MVRAMTDDDDHDDDMEGLHYFVRWKSERNSEEDGAAE